MKNRLVLHIYVNAIMCLLYFQINLRLILVSGKSKEFIFKPSDSASDIAQYVYDHWPDGKFLFCSGIVMENSL